MTSAVYTHPFDADHYNPPAPVIMVGVSRAGGVQASVELPALLDSGADATMLPWDVLEKVGCRQIGTGQMRGVVGDPVIVEIYLATLFVGPVVLRGIKTVAINQEGEPLIGRDVLNQLVVTLNGLAGVVEIGT
jgi:predicted aspartyl protease